MTRLGQVAGAIALVALVGLLGPVGPAGTQTGGPSPIPPGCPGGPAGPPTPGTVCPTPGITSPVSPTAQPAGESMIPDPQLPGKHPTRNYDIGFDSGAWNSLFRKALGFLTEVAWAVNRIIVSWCLWLVRWAFTFGLDAALAGPVVAIASVYHADLVGPASVADLVWTYLGFWCAFQVFRGRPLTAAGEFMVSLVVFGCSVLMMGNLAGYLAGAQHTTNQLAGAVVALGSGQPPNADPTATAQVVDPLRARLHEVFIEQPHDIINWGRPLTGECAAVRDSLLAEGAWGDSDTPHDRMSDAGCDAEADFNHDPTSERLFGAVMTALVSGVVLVFIAFVAFTVLVAKFFGLLGFAVAPFALIGGVLPGAGREILWGWLTWLLRTLMVVVGMAWLLSLMLLCAGALLTLEGVSLQERFGFLLVVVVGMFVLHAKIVHAGSHIAHRARQSLTGVRFGAGGRAGTGGLAAPPASGGFTGYGIGTSARSTVAELPGNRAFTASHAGRGVHHGHQQDRLQHKLVREQIRETRTRRAMARRLDP